MPKEDYLTELLTNMGIYAHHIGRGEMEKAAKISKKIEEQNYKHNENWGDIEF